MATEHWNQLKKRCCKHLRSREMFYDSDTADDEAYSSGLFWCAHTENCLGPDGQACGDEECGGDRGCHET